MDAVMGGVWRGGGGGSDGRAVLGMAGRSPMVAGRWRRAGLSVFQKVVRLKWVGSERMLASSGVGVEVAPGLNATMPRLPALRLWTRARARSWVIVVEGRMRGMVNVVLWRRRILSGWGVQCLGWREKSEGTAVSSANGRVVVRGAFLGWGANVGVCVKWSGMRLGGIVRRRKCGGRRFLSVLCCASVPWTTRTRRNGAGERVAVLAMVMMCVSDGWVKGEPRVRSSATSEWVVCQSAGVNVSMCWCGSTVLGAGGLTNVGVIEGMSGAEWIESARTWVTWRWRANQWMSGRGGAKADVGVVRRGADARVTALRSASAWLVGARWRQNA